MTSELQQILGYRDAIDDRDSMREVAPDVFAMPFWTPEFCATVISAAEAVSTATVTSRNSHPGRMQSVACSRVTAQVRA